MTEAEAKKAAAERGWQLEKHGKVFRLVTDNGTVVAGKWDEPDFYGLTLDEVASALEP